jgi:hypothetical protein
LATSPESHKGWSWLRLGAEATIAAVWVITIVSVLAGHWPGLARWFALLSGTGAAVGSRAMPSHPLVGSSILLLAGVLAVVGLVVSRQ